MADIDSATLLDDPRAKAGAAPIEGLETSEDVRDEPEFAWIETEFRKMESAGPAAVDWAALNRQTVEIIEKRSKDVVLGTRLAYGLHREEGYKGLAVGVEILKGMVSEHWETLYPPPRRERGRAGSFDWLAEKLAPTIEAEPPGEDAKLFALVAHDGLVTLDEQLSERLEKFQVALGPLIRALRPHAREARAVLDAQPEAAAQPEPAPQVDEAEPAPAVEASATTAEATAPDAAPLPAEAPTVQAEPAAEAPAPRPAATPAPAPAEPSPPPPSGSAGSVPAMDEIATGGGADRALQSVFGAVGRMATAIRKEAPGDPRVYLCSRFAIWGPIRSAPPSTAGKSALPPPQKAKLSEIEALASAGNQEGLLMAAESAFVSSPFWLDAQFTVAQAMQALGSSYDAARAAVIGELGAFLRRVDGLTGLSFSDGTPFANGETADWIAKEVQASSGGGDAGDGEMKRATVEATRLGQAGQVLKGLKLLTDLAESGPGGRKRFLARLEVGEYCLRFELLQPLFALVEKLRRTAEERALDVWEPQLSIAVASLSWRAYSHKNAKRHVDERELQERKARIVAALTDVDVVMAAQLSTTPPG